MTRESTEVRQVQIKKAVLEIIANEGLHNLSTRKLANRIGLTEGAIFRHFPTKRDIIIGIMNDVSTDLIGTLKKIVLSLEPSDKKLFAYLCKNVEYLKKNRGITILLFSEATHLGDNELKGKLNLILSEQKIFIKKIVEDGINSGLWNKNINTEDFANLYLGIPITFNIEMILNSDNFVVDNFCKKMYSLLLKILAK